MNDFESQINNIIIFKDRSEYNLKDELHTLDVSYIFLLIKLDQYFYFCKIYTL